jgi:hypothetical protein
MTATRFSWIRVPRAGMSVSTYPLPSWVMINAVAVPATYCFGT